MYEAIINKEVLDEIIIGRVKPHIYAFKTNTVPNYLKIGDTYRPVKTRLEEWKHYFSDLEKTYEEEATVGENRFFRDYSVHKYIVDELGRKRLEQSDINPDIYYSNEFFESTTNEDVEQAIKDIISDFESNGGKYIFYDINTSIPQPHHYFRGEEEWKPRPNQKDVIDNFKNAVDNGRNNLLMYAVMRFGKSFTSMMCAKEIDANLIVIVSAKADVKSEWKKTVEIPKNFENFYFVDSNDLINNENLITESLNEGKKIVVFLTLQDLQGDFIKDKHEDLFKQEIDLLIVDETHFGARGEKYGAIIKRENLKDEEYDYDENDSIKDIDNLDSTIEKVLNRKITLHLSGTPYRILMSSEFNNDDIIGFCQFSDIVDAQKKWDQENPDENERNNPYFGFPQMIRFAFNPSKLARKKLEALKKQGCSYAFYSLLKPKSIKKSNDGSHKIFENEQEVLELLEVIDGSKEDENVLGFLDYDKIKNGDMCRHIVIVLPYCASCDAMEKLINDNNNKFKNLSQYKIINISGVEDRTKYKKTDDVKNEIKNCEKNNIRTITLTVNRMLTGSTVEEWDTMIYLKDTVSPQEYDQAIFRLQNQYVKKVGEDEDYIKYNMKPQTLLVDFDPNRMFLLQEQKSQIYNFNTDEGGNNKVNERLQKEMEISPIITLNSNKIKKVEPIDILKVVSAYKMDKGIKDEALEIPLDLKILDDPEIMAIISRENELDSKNGLSVPAVDGDEDGDDLDVPDTGDDNTETNDGTGDNDGNEQGETDNTSKLEKKLLSFRTKILLFAFLINEKVISLSDIIDNIDNDKNIRISRNIGINKDILTKIYQYYHTNNKQILRQLDYKIQDLSDLSHNEELTPAERAQVVLKKFGKLGVSTIVTPSDTGKKMIDSLPNEIYASLGKKTKILDIASVTGEFPVAIYNKMVELDINMNIIKNAIYTITKTSICYELTRKLYEMIGLNTDNIATFYSEDLLKINNGNGEIDYDRIKRLLTQNKKFSEIGLRDSLSTNRQNNMIKFNAIIGNPPYQKIDGGGTGDSAKPLYDKFIDIAKKMEPDYISIICPARRYSGGKGLDDFREEMINDDRIVSLHDFPETADCFPGINIRGGVCYFLRDKGHTGNCKIYNHKQDKTSEMERPLHEEGCETLIRYNEAISILKKVQSLQEETLDSKVSSRKPFGIESNFSDYSKKQSRQKNVILYRSERNKSAPKRVFISENDILKNFEWKDKMKVLVSKASPGGDEYPHAIISMPIFAENNSVCTETYLIVDFVETEKQGKNLISYMKTKFFRFMVSLIKNTQNISKGVFAFVPTQNWNEKRTDEKLYKKYEINKKEIEFIDSMIKSID